MIGKKDANSGGWVDAVVKPRDWRMCAWKTTWTAFAPAEPSYPAQGVSSTPRPLFDDGRLWNTGSPACAGDDDGKFARSVHHIRLRVPAARCARGFHRSVRPSLTEGAGKAGRSLHPRPLCEKSAQGVTTGSADAIRLSLHNGFNGLLRALPGDEFVLSPSSAN